VLHISGSRALCVNLTMLVLLTNGCSPGAALSPPGHAHTPETAGAAPSASARFVIAVPARTAAAGKRAPAYISPATQSITIAVSGPTPVSQTANLTPTSTGCQSTLATTECTLTLALSPGSYSASLTTFDGLNGTGTALSADQSVAFTVASGQANTIALTLNGIPAQLLVSSLSSAAHQTATTNFKLAGVFPARLQATALDADGNIIVGPGSPTLSVSQTSGSTYTIVNPSTTTPNTFTLMPPVGNGASATFTLTAAYSDATCSQPGAVCTTTFITTAHQQTMIVDNDGPIGVYAWPYTGSPAPLIGYNGSAGLPGIAAFDPSGNLFIGDNAGGDVKEYAPPYTGAPVATLGDGVLEDVIPVFMAPNGTLLVGGFNNNALYAYAPPYTGSPTTITNGIDGPAMLAADASGNLYVANFNGANVTEYAPPYTGTSTALGTVSMALRVAATSNGDVFAASPAANSIDLFVPPFPGATTTITAGVSSASAIAIGPDGTTLFVGQSGTMQIDLYVPPYTAVASSTSGTSASSPTSLAFDAANDLFSADEGNDTVTIYPPPYTSTPLTISGVSQPSGVYLSP